MCLFWPYFFSFCARHTLGESGSSSSSSSGAIIFIGAAAVALKIG